MSQLSGSEKKIVDDPPYIPECEVFFEGGPGPEELMEACGCRKDFIPVKEFTLDHLQEMFRGGLRVTAAPKSDKANYTRGRVTVGVSSKNRPDTATYHLPVNRSGKGFIYNQEPLVVAYEKCPCHECKKSGGPPKKYFTVRVVTGTHIVFDDFEARDAVFELFHDDPGNEKLDRDYFLYGVKGVDSDLESHVGVGVSVLKPEDYDIGGLKKLCFCDPFFMECVSHDMGLYEALGSIQTAKRERMMSERE